ncbi:VanZ family protein [Butyricicoccus sp.]|uniref:VanZ family protein n=1 Tax=Butyricicoccus sp. TaxID=2049021 RepID=UPI003734DC4A
MSVKKRRSPLITVLLWLCLIAYVLLLLKVILFKFDHDTIVNILNDTDELAYTRVNLVPFQTIRFYAFSGRVPASVAVRNLAGNIVAFMPIGILIPLLTRSLSLGRTFLVGLALSAGIELTQFFTGLGSCDIDDIILNVLGAMSVTLILAVLDLIGFFLKKIAKIMRKSLDKKHRRV